MVCKELKKVKEGVYIGDIDRMPYLIKAVDRGYRKSSPVYYLEILEGGKARYLSGLFATDRKNVFSADKKDENGIKIFYTVTFRESGEKITVEKGKVKKEKMEVSR
jgi:hypothetical protein